MECKSDRDVVAWLLTIVFAVLCDSCRGSFGRPAIPRPGLRCPPGSPPYLDGNRPRHLQSLSLRSHPNGQTSPVLTFVPDRQLTVLAQAGDTPSRPRGRPVEVAVLAL